MSKIIFIDDEQEVLSHYQNALPRKSNESDVLRLMASELLEKKFEPEDLDSDLASVQAFTATQGLLGLDIIARELKSGDPVQVAFIDMRMPPGIDGKETAKRIRQLDPRMEIVIVTAYSDVRPDLLLKEIGIPAKLLYLKKPFDLSEIKQLIRNLTAKYLADRIKDEFLSNVTHELKTPLAAILGFSELLLPELEEKSSLKEYVSILHSNAQLMKSLITDLIETMEVSRDRMKICKAPTDLMPLMTETFLSLKAQNLNPHLSLQLRCPDHAMLVNIDSLRIKQVLYNLMGNALKFTAKGEVLMLAEDGADRVVLSISDTGEGIESSQLKRIFDKFYRIENAHHQRPGLGLGLYLVKQILDEHGLEFDLESSVGTGTTVRIIFPKVS